MQIFIQTTSAESVLRRLQLTLTRGQLNLTISRAINKTLALTRTMARSEVKKVYNISQKNLQGVDYRRSTPLTLSGSLVASRKPIPLDAFAPKQDTATGTRRITRRGALKVTTRSRPNPSAQGGISIEIFKGNRQNIPFAFLLPGGAVRVFARGQYKTGNAYGFIQRHIRVNPRGSDNPIKPLITLSDYGAILNNTVLDPIAKKTEKNYIKQLENQITFTLSQFS